MNYYTYAYLREDGTPYYIGRGKGNRAYDKTHRIAVPPKDRILFLKQSLSYDEATKHEVYMIAVLGRKDTNSGILRNLTDGGEGRLGPKPPEEIEKIKKALTGRKQSKEHIENISRAKRGVPIHSEKTKETRRQQFKNNNPNRDGNAVRGKKVWNNGLENKYGLESPGEGWVLGKLGGGFTDKTHTPEMCAKFSEDRKKRRHWVNKEGKTMFVDQCPGNGWKPGRKWRMDP